MKKEGADNNQRGFTLVEILVVLAIIVVLAVLVISGYSEGRPRLATERTAESFIGDIYRARNRGFLEFPYPMGGDHDNPAVVGYGIRIGNEENHYTFFVRDVDDNEEVIEEIEIEELVIIDSKKIDGAVAPEWEVFFKGRDVFFNTDKATEGSYAKIKFSARGDATVRFVVIDYQGVAYIIQTEEFLENFIN